MKEILITRITSQSHRPNKKGFHILGKNGKYWNGTYTGLLYCSYEKAPKNFLILEIENSLEEMLQNRDTVKLGQTLLKKKIIKKCNE
jgi:hypothetical protein